MVWFQCDDCGENLKKPKLNSHFGRCSASKFSCIDCGVTFDRWSVQSHTSCISEAEKYGPKAVNGKPVNVITPKKGGNQNSDNGGIDLQLGLSQRAPWKCSLCNVTATSQETLQGHAEGKKHKSKARTAFKGATNQGISETVPRNSETAMKESENGMIAESSTVDGKDSETPEQGERIEVLEKENGNARSSHEGKKKKLKENTVDAAFGEANGGAGSLFETANGDLAVGKLKKSAKKTKEGKQKRKLEAAEIQTSTENGKGGDDVNEGGKKLKKPKETAKLAKLETENGAPDVGQLICEILSQSTKRMKLSKLMSLLTKDFEDLKACSKDKLKTRILDSIEKSALLSLEGNRVKLQGTTGSELVVSK